MIPLEPFLSAPKGSREYNAILKAMRQRPKVVEVRAAWWGAHRFYQAAKYAVEIYADVDGQFFGECSCAAGSPPVDPATGLPEFESVPCYHLGAVLVYMSEEEDADVKTSGTTTTGAGTEEAELPPAA